MVLSLGSTAPTPGILLLTTRIVRRLPVVFNVTAASMCIPLQPLRFVRPRRREKPPLTGKFGNQARCDKAGLQWDQGPR